MNSRRARLFPFMNMHVPQYFAVQKTGDIYMFFFYSTGIELLIESVLAMLLFQLREYTLTESYHEDEIEVEFVSNDNLQANSEAPRGIDPNRDLNEAIAEERREMDTQRYRYVFSTPTFFILFFLLPGRTFYFVFCELPAIKSRAFYRVFGKWTSKSKNYPFLLCFTCPHFEFRYQIDSNLNGLIKSVEKY